MLFQSLNSARDGFCGLCDFGKRPERCRDSRSRRKRENFLAVIRFSHHISKASNLHISSTKLNLRTDFSSRILRRGGVSLRRRRRLPLVPRRTCHSSEFMRERHRRHRSACLTANTHPPIRTEGEKLGLSRNLDFLYSERRSTTVPGETVSWDVRAERSELRRSSWTACRCPQGGKTTSTCLKNFPPLRSTPNGSRIRRGRHTAKKNRRSSRETGRKTQEAQ